jgi:iron(III) transport system ATP-binding protein
MNLLEMKHITHSYTGSKNVLENFSFAVASGEIACLLGQSGCGKTTALRIIAGFERIGQGSVHIKDQQVAGESTYVVPEKRQVGVVFQDAALFPHLTVAKNIAFGLHNKPKDQQQQEVVRQLALIELPGMGDRYPHELSGGQRQRVALARAMAPQPQLILLDEPFSNLDTDLRQSLGRDIRRLLKDNQMTAILVTHDQDEAFTMADRIAVMRHGHILQMGTPQDLFFKPEDPYVANFLGKGAFLRAERQKDNSYMTPLGIVEPLQTLTDSQIQVLVRPGDLEIAESGITVKVIDSQYRGEHQLLHVEFHDAQTLSLTHTAKQPVPETLRIRLKHQQLPAFPLNK